jgi:DNA-binding response OmpR family regulator
MNATTSASILLVDDDELNLKVLSRRLSQDGFIVAMAASAAAALDILDRQHFDLVLLDIDMPGVNGIELLKQIQNRPHSYMTRVIMLSALDDPATIRNCLELGAVDYLVKPFVMSLARARIARCLRESGNPSSANAGRADNRARVRILIVDDDELSRRLLIRQLTDKGFAALGEGNSEKLLQRLQDDPVDLVLLDINMPQVSGIRLLKRLRNNPQTEHLPVIMVTAQDNMDSKLACIESGADGYIAKPVDMVLLMQSIGSTLKARDMDVLNIDLD